MISILEAFLKLRPIFGVLQSILTNFDENWCIIYLPPTPCSLFGPKLHNCNHANHAKLHPTTYW